MGTNYYALLPQCAHPCEHCHAEEELHICKSLTMFQAHDVTPWGRIESWADWREAIRKHGLTVMNEYGETLDREQFIADVEATDHYSRSRQYRWLVEHKYSLDRDYLDDDGFSFYRGEFS